LTENFAEAPDSLGLLTLIVTDIVAVGPDEPVLPQLPHVFHEPFCRLLIVVMSEGGAELGVPPPEPDVPPDVEPPDVEPDVELGVGGVVAAAGVAVNELLPQPARNTTEAITIANER